MCISFITPPISHSRHGAPDMIPVRSELKSYLLKQGCSSSATYIVGTPYSAVQRTESTACSTLSASNEVNGTIAAPQVNAPSIPSTHPKQLKNGTGKQTRSLVENRCVRPIQYPLCTML